MQETGPRVPPLLNGLAAISWRVLVVSVLAAAAIYLVSRVQFVLLAVFLAFLVLAVLAPLRSRLERLGAPHVLAVWIVFLTGILGLVGLLAAVIVPFTLQAGELWDSVLQGVDRVVARLADGPFGLPESTVEQYVEELQSFFENNISSIASGLLGTTMQTIELGASVLLALPLIFFFLKDSQSINGWLLKWVMTSQRARTSDVVAYAWDRVSMFVRGTAVVATFDALFIGLGLLILGVPLAGALAVLTFIGAFIPIVGAFAAGIAAVLVTLVLVGFVDALIVLGIVIAVQQIEGNIIAPLIVGRAVKLHPLVILLAVAIGGTVGGVFGAFIAVPLTTFAYSIVARLKDPGIEQAEEG